MKYEIILTQKEYDALKEEVSKEHCMMGREAWRILKNHFEGEESTHKPPTSELGPDYLGGKYDFWCGRDENYSNSIEGIRATIKSYLQGKIKEAEKTANNAYSTMGALCAYKDVLLALCGEEK